MYRLWECMQIKGVWIHTGYLTIRSKPDLNFLVEVQVNIVKNSRKKNTLVTWSPYDKNAVSTRWRQNRPFILCCKLKEGTLLKWIKWAKKISIILPPQKELMLTTQFCIGCLLFFYFAKWLSVTWFLCVEIKEREHWRLHEQQWKDI